MAKSSRLNDGAAAVVLASQDAIKKHGLTPLGHPLGDFAYHAMTYHMPPHIVAGLAGADLARLNIPSEEEYVMAYCRRTGRREIPNYNFYLAFNFFRLAAIFHGIKGRVVRGTAASVEAATRARALPELAALAWKSGERHGFRRILPVKTGNRFLVYLESLSKIARMGKNRRRSIYQPTARNQPAGGLPGVGGRLDADPPSPFAMM